MIQSTEFLERRRLLEVAREYEQNGYKVTVEPRGEQLPDFLSQFEPDLIAYRDGEAVVVEVKSKISLAQAQYLPTLTSVINATPGWTLELVVTNSRNLVVEADNVQGLSEAEIQVRLATASDIEVAAQGDAALLLAWSAAEAALRLLAERHSVMLESNQPLYVLKKLYSLGIISREDYLLLNEAMRSKNLISHGFRSPDLQDGFTRRLVGKVEELLQMDVEQSAA